MQKTQIETPKKTGFTLIEILVVIGLIALLATIVIIAITPARQFAQGRNTQRVSNVNAILNAIGQRMADDKGIFADGTAANSQWAVGTITYTCSILPNTLTPITYSSTATTGGSTTTGDMGCLIPTYISSNLNDPQINATGSNNYRVVQDATTGRVTVDAPAAELGQTISIQR